MSQENNNTEIAPKGREGRGVWSVLPAILAAAVVAIMAWVLVSGRRAPQAGLQPTHADLQVVHASVSLQGSPVSGVVRGRAGDAIETSADGRARMRLDSGAVVILDRSTKITLAPSGFTFAEGRAFVMGAPGSRTEIDVGGAIAILSDGNAAIERKPGGAASVYAANEELTVRDGAGADVKVQLGYSARVEGGKVSVAPERGLEDWTQGLAAPWAAKGPPRRAIGELWARANTAEPSQALTVRSHEVRARIAGELALTEVTTTFFNAGSETVTGDFRMALPEGAIVSRFAIDRGNGRREGRVGIASRGQTALISGIPVLEWAGEGWVRASVPGITAGLALKVTVAYASWLSPRPKPGSENLIVQYRYPMAGEGAPPLIGELYAQVDAGAAGAVSMAAGAGATVSGVIAELRKPDFRPSADLVVDVEIPPWRAPARAYLAGVPADADAGPVLFVRTEVPGSLANPASAVPEGVTLSIVMDTSQSMDPALFDAERALVEAIVGSLGERDRVIVLGADQAVRPVGPDKIGAADPARRKAIVDALGRLRVGGATDLGRAIETAADALPADAASGMVIYVGDGWPTVGDAEPEQVLDRLARRPGGVPRIGAVLVGPLTNQAGIATLVRGRGPLFEVKDSADAAHVAVELMADALQPTISSAELALGPEIERVYPRAPRSIRVGQTVWAVGRIRGKVPDAITLRYRDATGAIKEERRAVSIESAASEEDVARRWAAARVDEIAARDQGREAATDVAMRAGLLTPWTGWVIDGNTTYVPTPFSTRMLSLGAGPEGGFGARIATGRARGTIGNTVQDLDFSAGDESEEAYKAAVAAAARRAVNEAVPQVRACRDSRAALRPEVSGSLDIDFEIDGRGTADKISVRGVSDDDDALDRCVQVVIEGLPFPVSDISGKIAVQIRIELSPFRPTLRGRKCSGIASLPTALRRGPWRERLDRGILPLDMYLGAKLACELPTWTDQRTLLEMILDVVQGGLQRVGLARELDRAGEPAAAQLLQREAIRRARDTNELREIQAALIGDEQVPIGAFRKQYNAASNDAARLAVIVRFLKLAPHDARLRRKHIRLLQAANKTDELREALRIYRKDPFSDAALVADVASTLRAIGDEDEARRAFGEIAERAPEDPWARAFLGDRLRNEKWFDDATLAYEALEAMLPGDAATGMRLALAHAGAGRLDVARRLLTRVAQTGGRSGDSALGDLSGFLAQALVADARAAKPDATDLDRLTRAALELPFPSASAVFLVQAPAGSVPIEVTFVRGPKEAREERPAALASPSIGLYATTLGGDAEVLVRLARPQDLPPAPVVHVRVVGLTKAGTAEAPVIAATELDLPPDGKAVEVRWSATGWAQR